MTQPSSTSTISAARAALYDLLLADAPDRTANTFGELAQPIQISYGPPAHEEMEVVALLGVRQVDEDWSALGAQRREETYQIEVGVKVHNPAAGAASAANKLVYERGAEITEWVRSVVHHHWTLNDTVRVAAVTGFIDSVLEVAEKGAIYFALMAITCEADIFDAGAAP